MGFFTNLFKDKKKDHSRDPSEHEHEHHHSHHDPSPKEGRASETVAQQQEPAPVPKAHLPHPHNPSHAEHSKEIPQHPNEQLPSPHTAADASKPPTQPAPHAAQHSQPPAARQAEIARQQRTQAPQRSQVGLKPAYCYTGGEFSETISREEAMLAKQYNFAAAEDRAHAELTPSATRRNVAQPTAAPGKSANAARNEEFDSLFTQFMHETSNKQ